MVLNEEEWRRRRRVLNRFGYVGQYARLGDAVYDIRRRAEAVIEAIGDTSPPPVEEEFYSDRVKIVWLD